MQCSEVYISQDRLRMLQKKKTHQNPHWAKMQFYSSFMSIVGKEKRLLIWSPRTQAEGAAQSCTLLSVGRRQEHLGREFHRLGLVAPTTRSRILPYVWKAEK